MEMLFTLFPILWLYAGYRGGKLLYAEQKKPKSPYSKWNPTDDALALLYGVCFGIFFYLWVKGFLYLTNKKGSFFD